METGEILGLIGRSEELFEQDLLAHDEMINDIVSSSRFLVIGGAGSIGQAVVHEIFERHPLKLHVVDISENNMVELVRDIRSTLGYIEGDFSTFAIDCGSHEFRVLLESGEGYDFVLNLSALKHVRSEKDPFTLIRLIETNILNTIETVEQARSGGAQKYFCVSTDKAANPVNIMGASKRIMEMFLMRESEKIPVSMARFANVAFSDGSLLHGFTQRFSKRQPIAAPNDVRRYFMTPKESGILCLLSCLFGDNRDIFFPMIAKNLQLTTFSEIAERYVKAMGFQVYECNTEAEARDSAKKLIDSKLWPCYFFESDTTGEKDYEEFFSEGEIIDTSRFFDIGIIENEPVYDNGRLERFILSMHEMRNDPPWDKNKVLESFRELLPNFFHKETGKYLDGRM